MDYHLKGLLNVLIVGTVFLAGVAIGPVLPTASHNPVPMVGCDAPACHPDHSHLLQ